MKAFYKIILLLYGCYFSLAATGQNLNLVSPITISMPNNPVANTDDWGKGAQPFIITAKKNTPNELQSWMLVTIKKGGSKICGSNTPQTAPEVYFDVPLKTWVGTTAISQLGNGCVLQPGEYELCVQFYLKDRRTIIGENCKSFTIKESKPETYSPPQNILPAPDKKFTVQEAGQPIQFRWTPIVPKPKAKVKYTVRIWNIPIKGSKSQAIKNQQPIIIKETNELTQLSVPPSEFSAAKNENNSYAWNVEASKTSAMGDIEMLGTSEATEFNVASNETQLSCDCGGWELFTVNNKNYTCGQKINWKCNEPIDFSARYNCKPNDGSCIARIECEVKKDGVIIKNFGSGPHPYIDHAKFTPTENGVYTITLYPTCNGKPCPPCILTFTVTDCVTASNCNCKTVQCTKKLWYKDVSTGIIKEFACINQTPIVLNCDKNYQFFADTKCSPDPNCKMIVKGEFRNAAGALVIQQTAFSTSSAFNIISSTPGNYTFIIRFYVNDVECGNCTIPIKVSCNLPADCCKGGFWELFTANDKNYSCGDTIDWKCKVPLNISARYNCNPSDPNCKTTLKWDIKNEAGVVIKNGVGGVQKFIYGQFTPVANGIYTSTVYPFCNGKECPPCTFTIKVNDCNIPLDCCKNSSWYNKVIYSGSPQTPPAPLAASGTNLGVWPCKSPKAFQCSYSCTQGCAAAQINYSIFSSSNVLVSSVTAASSLVVTLTTPGVTGAYKLVIAAICGKDTCNKLEYTFEVQCPPPTNCCQNATQKDPSVYDAAGTNLATFSCTQPKTYYIIPTNKNCDKELIIKASSNCGSTANCTSKIVYTLVNTGTSATLTGTGILTIPATLANGGYTLTVDYYCGNTICKSCKFNIKKDCPPSGNCCQNGTWGDIGYKKNGTNMWMPPVNGYLDIMYCNSDVRLKACFNCGSNCGTAKINYTVLNAANTVISTGTVANCAEYVLPIPTTGTHNYSLVIGAICGADTCKRIYKLEIDCQLTTNCCQGSFIKTPPTIKDAAGAVVQTLDCATPKTFYINAANKNCDKAFTISGALFSCNAALPNCIAKVVYTLVNTSTSASLTGTGNLIIPASLANGAYVLTVDYYCGNTICKTCKFEIKKDCPPVVDDCCKNSSWGEKILYTSGGFSGGAVPKPLPASGSNLGVVKCSSTKQFKICYDCAQGCGTAQIKYDVYKAYSLVLVSSTTVASCSVANITMPATTGNYQIRIAAICNGKECNAIDYFINTECTPVDCCKGGSWTNKSLDWDIKIKIDEAEGTALSTDPAQKATPQNKKDKKTPAGISKTVVDINAGPSLNPFNGSIKVGKCGDTLKIAEGNEFTLNAAYTCNVALANCTGKVIAKVKDPNGITYGAWPLPRLFKFATPGLYTVTYYAYCGETICDSCTFYVNAAKDCCKGSKWIKADYQIVNKKQNGDPDRGNGAFYTLPTIIGAIPTYKADLAIDVENLNYQCAAAQGCNTGYIIRRRNLTTGALVYPDETLPPGQVSTSIYTKPFPQIITVTPTCGGKACGNPIIFKVECLSKDCIPVCVSDTIVFSTGMTTTGTAATTTEPQWFASEPLKILSSGTAPFFGTSGTGGAATILQDVVDVDNITSYKAYRNIIVSKNCTINFSGKLGISKSTLDTWATLFKSFKLLKGGPTGSVVWTYVSGTAGTVGTYATNNFNGTVAVAPDIYTFVFEYYKAGPDWNYNSMFVTGIIVRNILPTSKDCCAASNTGNTATSYGQAGNLNGLNLNMDTCSCNEGKWDFGFEINGMQAHWSMLSYSPPLSFTCIPSSYPLKLSLVYVCNQNWKCTFNVKLVKKNLATNIETVVVSQNDIIPYSSYYNHSALRTWLYPENDICQYTIIPYCNGKECGDRLGFNINSKIAAKANQETDLSATCNACGKKFAISDLKVHQRICEKKPTKTVAGKNAGAGYSCDCCNGVYTAEQLIKHAKTCCKKKEDLNAMNIDKKPKLMCKCCGKDFTGRNHNPECCLDKETGEPGVIISKGILTNYYCKCCNKSIAFTGAAAAATHQKECCAKPATTTTVTAGKMISPGQDSYVCAYCNEPISGGASGLATHESKVHNMVATQNNEIIIGGQKQQFLLKDGGLKCRNCGAESTRDHRCEWNGATSNTTTVAGNNNNSINREVDGKGRPASVVYGGTIDRQTVVQKDSADTNGNNNNAQNREVDGKGRPASVVYGGTIDRQTVVQKDSADTNGNNNKTKKGWDGHISAGKITFPPNCFAIFCPTGTVGVDGKCVPLVTTLEGSYAISNGMLNGKKELMSSEEVNNAVGRIIQYALRLEFKGVIIKNIDGVPNVVAVYYSEADKTIQTFLVPLINEKGYLKMQGTSTLITQEGDKQTISKGPEVSSKKHDYVGHVTLIK